MTLTVFMTLVTILSLVSSLFTEAIKKNFEIKNSPLAILIISVLIGWGGGAITYSFMKIPFTDVNNLLCLFLLGPVIWLSATLGYDKVREVILKIGASV